jgi:hypothetical protein
VITPSTITPKISTPLSAIANTAVMANAMVAISASQNMMTSIEAWGFNMRMTFEKTLHTASKTKESCYLIQINQDLRLRT